MTVTGVEDGTANASARTATVSHTMTSDDTSYHDIAVGSVAVTVTDTVPGVTVSESAVSPDEGAEATYTVVLTSKPSADVVVAVASDDIGVAMVSPTKLTFTATTWPDEQTVTVSGVDDDSTVDANARTTSVSHMVTSDDDAYDGASISKVSVTVIEDDTVPGSPTAPTLAPGHRQIAAAWSAPGDDGGRPITGYTVQWKEASLQNWPTPTPDNSAGVSETRYIVTGLTNDTSYAVRVQAANALGNGAWSKPVTATPFADGTALYRKLSQSILPRVGLATMDDMLWAVENRVETLGAAPALDSVSLTLGGVPAWPAAAPVTRLNLAGFDSGGLLYGADGLTDAGVEPGGRTMSVWELMSRSSFSVQPEKTTPMGGLAVWGAGRYRNLSSDDDTLDWRGDLYGTQVGVDSRTTHGQWLRGLLVDWSDGRFEWNGTDDPTGGAFRTGSYDVELTGAYPYAGWTSVDGVWRLWGVGGYAWGQVGVTEADPNRDAQRSDLAVLMGALGASRDLRLIDGVMPGGVMLRMKGNASTLWFDLAGNAAKGRIEPLNMSAHRLRLALEASREQILQGGRRVVSSLGVGARGDFWDGNTGVALETNAELLYLRPELGLTLGSRGYLLALSDDGAQEWGIDVVLSYDAGKSRRGLMLDMSSGYGVPSHGLGGLWDQDAARLPISTPSMLEPRLAVEVGYGFPVASGHGSWAPYGAYAMTRGDDESFRVGGRWEFNSGLWLTLEGERRQACGSTEDRVLLLGRTQF